jgi:hypothetical protein
MVHAGQMAEITALHRMTQSGKSMHPLMHVPAIDAGTDCGI